jgi:hypothetical protein
MRAPERRSLPATYVTSLPSDLLVYVLSAIDDVRALSRLAATCRLLHKLILLEEAPWEKLTIPASSVREDKFCGSSHAFSVRELRVHVPLGSTHRPTFCKLAAASHHPFAAGCGGLRDAGAIALVRVCPRLRELHLPGMGHLSVEALRRMLRDLPSLETLNLRGCEAITEGFGATTDAAAPDDMPSARAPQLLDLDLSHVYRASDLDVIALLSLVPSLRTLQLSFCAKLTDAVLESLPAGLERLNALGCERMSFGRLESLQLALGVDEHGVPRLASDDSAVLACSTRCRPFADPAQSLFQMLAAYRREELRWA